MPKITAEQAATKTLKLLKVTEAAFETFWKALEVLAEDFDLEDVSSKTLTLLSVELDESDLDFPDLDDLKTNVDEELDDRDQVRNVVLQKNGKIRIVSREHKLKKGEKVVGELDPDVEQNVD
jgi:hypothetical protein